MVQGIWYLVTSVVDASITALPANEVKFVLKVARPLAKGSGPLAREMQSRAAVAYHDPGPFRTV